MNKLLLTVTKLLKSRTLIVNWATLVATTLTLWLASPAVMENPAWVAALTPILAGANIILRAMTSVGLEDK